MSYLSDSSLNTEVKEMHLHGVGTVLSLGAYVGLVVLILDSLP